MHQVLLVPVVELLLHLKAFDVVGIHDFHNRLVIFKNTQSWQTFWVIQILLVLV